MRYDRSPEIFAAIQAASGVSALAQKLGISAQTVSEWKQIPERHLDAVSELTGLPKATLRPDLYRDPAA